MVEMLRHSVHQVTAADPQAAISQVLVERDQGMTTVVHQVTIERIIDKDQEIDPTEDTEQATKELV